MPTRFNVHGKDFELDREYLPDIDYEVNEENNDGCSGVIDKLHGFNFNWVCDIHDDFYQSEFEGTRLEADLVLFAFMCLEVRRQSNNPHHEMWGYLVAYRRYLGVRMFGWLFWKPDGSMSIFEKIKSFAIMIFTVFGIFRSVD